jgi:hypothetical protein
VATRRQFFRPPAISGYDGLHRILLLDEFVERQPILLSAQRWQSLEPVLGEACFNYRISPTT